MPGIGAHKPSAPSEGLREIRLTDQEFSLFRALVENRTGISLGPFKREMLRARLGRRLRALRLDSFSAYYQLLHDDVNSAEWGCFVNAVTTNVTSFFREEHHFQYLSETWVPVRRTRLARTGNRTMRIWSVGCSTGEEAYTLAVVIREALGASARCWDLRILASDIDTDALQRARAGIYPMERTAKVPRHLLKRYFLRGVDVNKGLVRVQPEVQSLIAFRHINLMDDSWPIHTRFDVIFCRNVLIYFDRSTQKQVLERLSAFLKEDGLLFLGHSESLHGLHSGMKYVANTIYQMTGAVKKLRSRNGAVTSSADSGTEK